MEALKTSTALLLFPCSVDCQQIILSTCRILLDQWEDGLVAKVRLLGTLRLDLFR